MHEPLHLHPRRCGAAPSTLARPAWPPAARWARLRNPGPWNWRWLRHRSPAPRNSAAVPRTRSALSTPSTCATAPPGPGPAARGADPRLRPEPRRRSEASCDPYINPAMNLLRSWKGASSGCEGAPLATIADAGVGTPVYVYSSATLERHHGPARRADRRGPERPADRVCRKGQFQRRGAADPGQGRRRRGRGVRRRDPPRASPLACRPSASFSSSARQDRSRGRLRPADRRGRDQSGVGAGAQSGERGRPTAG